MERPARPNFILRLNPLGFRRLAVGGGGHKLGGFFLGCVLRRMSRQDFGLGFEESGDEL